jgi:hypothetical protein
MWPVTGAVPITGRLYAQKRAPLAANERRENGEDAEWAWVRLPWRERTAGHARETSRARGDAKRC